jgi:hypothetical protein
LKNECFPPKIMNKIYFFLLFLLNTVLNMLANEEGYEHV